MVIYEVLFYRMAIIDRQIFERIDIYVFMIDNFKLENPKTMPGSGEALHWFRKALICFGVQLRVVVVL